MEYQVESRIRHKHNHRQRQRKARYTFPNEVDENESFQLSPDSPTRRHSMSGANVEKEYNKNMGFDQIKELLYEKHFIITKTNEGVKKEMIIKKYNKIHPTHIIEEETPEDNILKTISNKSSKILNSVSKAALKIVYYIGILSCIVI